MSDEDDVLTGLMNEMGRCEHCGELEDDEHERKHGHHHHKAQHDGKADK